MIYRKASLQFHPDKGGDPEQFKKLGYCWATLWPNGEPSVGVSNRARWNRRRTAGLPVATGQIDDLEPENVRAQAPPPQARPPPQPQAQGFRAQPQPQPQPQAQPQAQPQPQPQVFGEPAVSPGMTLQNIRNAVATKPENYRFEWNMWSNGAWVPVSLNVDGPQTILIPNPYSLVPNRYNVLDFPPGGDMNRRVLIKGEIMMMANGSYNVIEVIDTVVVAVLVQSPAGGASPFRLLSSPTRKVRRSSSSKKRHYSRRQQASQTGKGGYRPTKTGRKA